MQDLCFIHFFIFNIFHLQNIYNVFDRYMTYSENSKTVTLQQFQSFLIQEQRDELAKDERKVSEFICEFLKVRWLYLLLYFCLLS